MSGSNRKNSVRLKVCGLKHGPNLRDVADAGVDMVGLIFYPPSPRYMADVLLPDDVTSLSENIQKVGVFVNQDIEQIIGMVNAYQLDIIQLHGNESPEYCQSLRDRGILVMKAFGVDEYFDFQVMEPYQEVVDYFLFDTKTPQHGGSGNAFDWYKLKEYPFNKPFLVGGGVGLENLEALLSLNLPQLHAVDMNSRLELSPGLKEVGKVLKAVELVMEYNSQISA